MLNERQYIIVDLLVKTKQPMTAEEIAKIVVRSKRTIMRDLSSIKIVLETSHIAQLLVNVDRLGYRIKIDQYEAYVDFMKKSIRDEEVILFELINDPYITMEHLSELLYVSKITASEKMNVIKENYGDVLNIEVSHKGHHLNEPTYKKCMLVSNLVEHNTKYYLDKAQVSVQSYERLVSQMEHWENIKEYFPNVLPQQIANLFIAAILLDHVEGQEHNDEIAYVYENANIHVQQQAIYVLIQTSDHCININLNLSEKQIRQALRMIEEENLVRFDEKELSSQLYMHLKRSLSYPVFVRTKEIHNIANIKALYPFSFDLSIVFINYMSTLYGYQIPDRDFIGLYFAVGMEKRKKKKSRVVLYGYMNSIANINKQLLEASISNCSVEIADDLNDEIQEDSTLIINGTKKALHDVEHSYHVESILSDHDIASIRNMIENIAINKNIRSVFPKNYSFTYDVKEKEGWTDVIRHITNRLSTSLAISKEEANRILEREHSGNSLVIGSFSIPHCISKKEDFCISIYVRLSKAVMIENSAVSHVLVTLMNPSMKSNINIFKYLYRYLNHYEQELADISTYEEFITYI